MNVFYLLSTGWLKVLNINLTFWHEIKGLPHLMNIINDTGQIGQ